MNTAPKDFPLPWTLAAFVSALFCAPLSLYAGDDEISSSPEQHSAEYQVRVDITWSAQTAPLDFPEHAHLTRIIGATHHGKYVLFRDGHTASSGLELIAENGRLPTLEAELAEAKRRGRVGTVFYGPALDQAPGSLEFAFTATQKHSLVSFVTMIAPSPDWFTGVADLALYENEAWIDEHVVPLWAWDSGTDLGQSYVAANAEVQPQKSVRLLATPHFLTDEGLVPMGTLTLRRLE